MNVFKITTHNRNRDGVTIIEVLTSIVVAVIGVAGVLVMIPFGIRQASVGLDLDSSATMAENAIARFQIEGYGQTTRFGDQEILPWIDVPQLGDATITPVRIDDTVSYYFIDPLWLGAPSIAVGAAYPTEPTIDAMFSYVGTSGAAENDFQTGISAGGFNTRPFQPRYAQLLDLTDPFDETVNPPQANRLSFALAARMFVSRNELQFAAEIDLVSGQDLDNLAPPQPYLDLNVAGDNVRRQASGEISWSAVAVARRATGAINLTTGLGTLSEGFDFHILVYKDRSFEDPTNVLNPDRDPRFLYTELTPLPAPPVNNPYVIQGPTNLALPVDVDIRTDQWVMLINYDRQAQAQVGFYRVVGSDPTRKRISIDGPDFTIQETLISGMPNYTTTYVVYLPNVINVYKRQLSLEAVAN